MEQCSSDNDKTSKEMQWILQIYYAKKNKQANNTKVVPTKKKVKHQISTEKVFLNLFKFKAAVFISFRVVNR